MFAGLDLRCGRSDGPVVLCQGGRRWKVFGLDFSGPFPILRGESMFPSFPLGGGQGAFVDGGSCGCKVAFVGRADDGGTYSRGEGGEAQGGARPVAVGRVKGPCAGAGPSRSPRKSQWAGACGARVRLPRGVWRPDRGPDFPASRAVVFMT